MKTRTIYFNNNGSEGGGIETGTGEDNKDGQDLTKVGNKDTASLEKEKADKEAKEKLEKETKDKTLKTSKEEKEKTEAEIKSIIDKNEKGEQLSAEETKKLTDAGYKLQEPDASQVDTEEILKELTVLVGEELSVEFGEDEINTSKGILKYAKAYGDKRLTEYEEKLKAIAPKAFLALQMEIAGENPASLYTQINNPFINKEIKKEDIASQKEIIKQSMKLKGIEDEYIIDFIEAQEEKGKLFDTAKKEQEILKKTDDENFKLTEKQRIEKLQKQDNEIEAFTNTLSSSIGLGKIDNITIPEKDKEAFEDFVLDRIQYKDGKFVIVEEVDPSKLTEVLKNEFFKYRKGDVQDLVAKKAAQEKVLILKKAVAKSGISSQSSDLNSTSKKLTLNDL